MVDGDGGVVPVEDVPLEAGAAFVDGDAGEAREEGAADSLASQRGGDVEVFEADAVMAEPGGVAGEEEGEAGGSGWAFGEALCSAMRARKRGGRRGRERRLSIRGESPAVAQEVGFGGDDGVGSRS